MFISNSLKHLSTNIARFDSVTRKYGWDTNLGWESKSKQQLRVVIKKNVDN